MQPPLTEAILSPHKMSFLFQLSMLWRIVYGLLRIIMGVAFLRLIGQPLSEFVYTIMSHEVMRGTDVVLGKIYQLFETHDFTISYFIATYFIFWGIVDIVLSLSLLRRIKIAFPITMVLILLFICYGIFRFSYTHSLVLLGVIIIDIGIIYLINREYKKLKREMATP